MGTETKEGKKSTVVFSEAMKTFSKIHPQHHKSEITFAVTKLPETIGEGYCGNILSDGFLVQELQYFDYLGRVTKKTDATKLTKYISLKYKRFNTTALTTWETKRILSEKEISDKFVEDLLDEFAQYQAAVDYIPTKKA